MIHVNIANLKKRNQDPKLKIWKIFNLNINRRRHMAFVVLQEESQLRQSGKK